MKKSAIISDCNQYRYLLSRVWDESKPLIMFMMLNPSTADADIDDPTIRRCIGFAKSWDYGGIYVGNLFAFRATIPKDLILQIDPIGKHNIFYLKTMEAKCEGVVYSWGNSPIVRRLQKLFPNYDPLYTYRPSVKYYIELSKDGTPKHPLYLKGNLTQSFTESRSFTGVTPL